jgi:hypothetical protein
MIHPTRPTLEDAGSPAAGLRSRLTQLALAMVRRPAATLAVLLPGMTILYAALLTRGSFDFFRETASPFAFNSMLLHLLDGRFDVDPDTIGHEGFAVNGRIYSYFGIFPALLRLIFLPFVDLRTTSLTIPSCLIATLILASAQLMLTLRLFRRFGAAGRLRLFFSFVAIALLAGPQILFLRPSIYQEVVQWSLAFAYLFVWLIFEILLLGRRPTAAVLVGLASLAGLALLTRVSVAVALYGAMSVLLLGILAGFVGEKRPAGRVPVMSGRILGPVALLGLFAAVALTVNQMRFGNPLKFIDLHYQLVSIIDNPDRIPRLDRYGEFNVSRLWYGLLYYFVPLWMIRTPDGLLAFPSFRHRMVDMVELPPSSFLLSDPLLLVFAAVGLVLTIRALSGADRARSAVLLGVAGAMALPCLLVLGAISFAFRYRGDFYPLFLLLAFAGLHYRLSAPLGMPDRTILPRLAAPLAVVGILSATILLGLYYLSPFGDSESQLRQGWIQLYRGRVAAPAPHGPTEP